MKIWRNDKRVVKDSGYTYCTDCCLNYRFPDNFGSICLATRFNIKSGFEMCLNGYKYETDV
jgi:pyruvate-formate lyase